MADILISTREVADMFNVAETTIKRWADENIIPCVKTPGGHRKFALREIARFAETNGYSIGGSPAPPMTPAQLEQMEIGVHTRNYARIANVFLEEALQADREGMFTLLLYLYKVHIPFPVIIDEVIRPAFASIGAQWAEGNLAISREHAATQAATEALIRLAPELYHKPSNGMSAVCACLDGDFHEIGLRGLAFSLECEGWKVHYIGANTPVDTVASFVLASRPHLICLSITMGTNNIELLHSLKKVVSHVHSYQGKIIVGGNQAESLRDHDIPCDHVARSIQDAVAYARDAFGLKPGPKKKPDRKTMLDQ